MGCQCQSVNKSHQDNISKWSFSAITLETWCNWKTISVLLGPFVFFSEAFKLWNFDGVFSYGKFMKVHFLYIPGTQLTLVLIGKGLVLGGWPSKMEVSWVLGLKYFYKIHRISLIQPLKSYPPKRKLVFQPWFLGAMSNFGGVSKTRLL